MTHIYLTTKIETDTWARSTSIFDVQIHSLSTEDDIADLNIQKMWYDLREEIEGMDFSECRIGYAFGTFTHLTAGYDMCYYSYLW
jgi:metallopeptidase MepB